jgi:chromosome segregation ATPase
MAEELGTRDVLEQVDARLDNVERDIRDLRNEMKTEIRDLRNEMNSRFDRVYQEIGGLRVELHWMYGLLVAVLLGVAGLWFK